MAVCSSSSDENSEMIIHGIKVNRGNLKMPFSLRKEFYKSGQPIYLCFRGALRLSPQEEFTIIVLNKRITLIECNKIQQEILLGQTPSGIFAQIRSLEYVPSAIREEKKVNQCLGSLVYSSVPNVFQHIFSGLEYDYVTFDVKSLDYANEEEDLSDSFDIDDPDFALMFSNTAEIFVGACTNYYPDCLEIEC